MFDYCYYYNGKLANDRASIIMLADLTLNIRSLVSENLYGVLKIERIGASVDYPKVSLLVPCYVDGELQQAGYILHNSPNAALGGIKINVA